MAISLGALDAAGQPRAARTARWLPWAVLIVVATLLGVIDASQVQYDRAVGGEPITWGHALIHGLPRWYAWAVLTPVILLVARHAQRAALGWPRMLLLHVVAGVAVTLVQVAFFSASSTAMHGGPATDVIAHLQPAFFKYVGLMFLGGLVTYALIVGGWHAWDLYRRYREQERTTARLGLQASELKALLAETQLRNLEAQLQPHFLFNTLHALSGLVLKGDTTNAVRMTSRLSDLLRRSLRAAESSEIELDEELHLVEDYLALQRIRFGDRLRATIDVEAAARRALVPTLILQPLVENAIRHAVEADPQAGRIEIRAWRDGDRLRLGVRDDGPGLGAGIERTEGQGLGLANTRARLQTLHGDDATLRLGAAEGGGILVQVELPFRVVEPDEGDAVSESPIVAAQDRRMDR